MQKINILKYIKNFSLLFFALKISFSLASRKFLMNQKKNPIYLFFIRLRVKSFQSFYFECHAATTIRKFCFYL